MNSSHSTSTSSSGSTTSSGSSSCTDSGSSSTDSESTTSSDAKPLNTSRPNDSKSKQQVTTRRKSSENKTNQQKANVDSEKTATKISPTNSTSQKQSTKSFVYSSDDDTPPTKKPLKRLSSSVQTNQRRRSTGPFALTASKLQKTQSEASATAIGPTTQDGKLTKPCQGNGKDKEKNVSPAVKTDNEATVKPATTPAKRLKQEPVKPTLRQANVNNGTDSTSAKLKPIQTKRNIGPSQPLRRVAVAAASSTRKRGTYDSEYDSMSGTDDDTSSSSTETESSENSSYNSKAGKGGGGNSIGSKRRPKNNHSVSGVKNKNDLSDSEGINPTKNTRNRKLTRSLCTRRNSKQQVKTSAGASHPGGVGSESDSEPINGASDVKRSLCKSPSKKAYIGLGTAGFSKCNVKKEISNNGYMNTSRAPTPPQLEKRCPVDGCDSSGHLSGNLDRHFLPEACPIYHNMSVSECKERANERKLRSETINKSTNSTHLDVQKPNYQSSTKHQQTLEQKEFYNKIKESRNRFKPIAEVVNCDKIKLEKDCNDEDREPSLIGLVPDYDLQLFRDAQALASEKIEEEVKDLPIGKGIKYITMGKYKMKVWYQSPYPEDVSRLPQMYICEFCLRYQKSETGIKRHAKKCVWRHPPGDEIYRKGKLQVWQVDGKRHKQYCQHLCLLAKFFLDHKTLYYDVEPFLFYIMTLADVDGCHIVGYFSKEKNSFYNVSCILTLPPYQRKGYGRLLIDFSYLLTRVERKIGSPEKPLSDLGLISYRSYWKDVLLEYLCNRTGSTLSIKDVSQEMAIYSYDIVSTLQALGMMKYWKGKHIVLRKQEVLDEYAERIKRRGTFPKIDETCLRWIPFVPQQNNDSP